ncbi:TPA: glycosyltransferase [Klebsiella quasipneumoniae subsp. similipneumoniae]|nr:glycosyltransferase [Klebsiella quasipneumoniae]HDC4344242.1 glycosyltransferase [Klebsiella quasipneumoniae]HDT1828655.1 glycosyltransferase [Klebsiella quasipneumoniae subsp. similipneumoniae]
MTMNKLVFLSMHLPSPDVPQAGQKLAYERLVKLSQVYEVHLISFVNELEGEYFKPELYSKCKSRYFFKLSKWSRLLNVICNISKPSIISLRTDFRVKSKIEEILSQYPGAHIHIEYEQGGVYITNKMHGNVSLVFHDVISQSLERFAKQEDISLKKFFFTHQYEKLLVWEKEILKNIDQAIVLNNKDSLLIKELSPTSNVLVDYPVVSDIFHSVKRDNIKPKTLLFWGAMNRRENVDAVMWFVKNIYPKILNVDNNYTLYIVGSNPTKEIIDLESDNIIVTGYVEDPIPYFEMAHVSIVPLRYGAGIKLKVIEALEAKLPVISTDVGAEGIENYSSLLYVANSEKEFRDAVLLLTTE